MYKTLKNENNPFNNIFDIAKTLYFSTLTTTILIYMRNHSKSKNKILTSILAQFLHIIFILHSLGNVSNSVRS